MYYVGWGQEPLEVEAPEKCHKYATEHAKALSAGEDKYYRRQNLTGI